MIHVRVLAFASAVDSLGCRERAMELPPGARVADALANLSLERPQLAARIPALATSVNGQIVAADRLLNDGDEMALLPQFSGG